MFASEAFEGSISDRQIVIKSNILENLDKDDVVLADRGFCIHDLVLAQGGSLVIPPFLGKREKFTKEEIIQTKIIARSRIHIERFNARLKNYRILSGIVSAKLLPYLSQLVFVLSNFVNFQEPLVKLANKPN